MRWPEVLNALVAALEADTELTTLLSGPHIYRSQDLRTVRDPSVAWTLIVDTEAENTEEILVQWDVWSGNDDTGVAILRKLRKLLTARAVVEVGGVRMWMLFEGGRDQPDEEDGVSHRSFDGRYIPAREE